MLVWVADFRFLALGTAFYLLISCISVACVFAKDCNSGLWILFAAMGPGFACMSLSPCLHGMIPLPWFKQLSDIPGVARS